MNVSFLDANGKTQMPTMGSYGIGLDRTLASIIEEYHDEAGILWPASVAPYHVIIVPIMYDGAVKENADKLATELAQTGLEVLLDDRNERPGVKFADADLIGIPWRVVISGKGLSQPAPHVEIKRRREKDARMVELGKAASELALAVREELFELNR
jgi:prolyl-tRNA synthetase